MPASVMRPTTPQPENIRIVISRCATKVASSPAGAAPSTDIPIPASGIDTAMIERIARAGRLSVVATQTDALPYSIELWDEGGEALERVLARAIDAQLARAIFHAARKEHPDGRILLRRGSRTIADSAD